MRGPNSEPPQGNYLVSSQPSPHQMKSYFVSGTKIYYGDIQKYTGIYFQNRLGMRFLGVKKWCSASVISDTMQKHVCQKICKVRKGFGGVLGAYYFQCQVS